MKHRHVSEQAVLLLMAAYFALPIWWMIVASTKDNGSLFASSAGPLFFGSRFDLLGNIQSLFTYDGGIYLRWLANSLLYAVVAGAGATALAVPAGYGFAKFRFPGRGAAFTILLGAVMVPATALVIPTFVLLSKVQLLNTMWAVILPSLLSPFGVYLMRVYTLGAVPDELLDAARVDGAGELRVFVSVALPLLRPAIVTVLLVSMVGTWNNYFLPLVVLSDRQLLPVTVGLGNWQAQSTVAAAGEPLWNLVITGSLFSVLPLMVAFVGLQKYWQRGLSLGSLK